MVEFWHRLSIARKAELLYLAFVFLIILAYGLIFMSGYFYDIGYADGYTDLSGNISSYDSFCLMGCMKGCERNV